MGTVCDEEDQRECVVGPGQGKPRPYINDIWHPISGGTNFSLFRSGSNYICICACYWKIHVSRLMRAIADSNPTTAIWMWHNNVD
jgi:hypothetical protein